MPTEKRAERCSALAVHKGRKSGGAPRGLMHPRPGFTAQSGRATPEPGEQPGTGGGEAMRSRFSRVQMRDLMLILAPALLVIGGAVWLALRIADPPPPTRFVISAATAGSPYYRYAERYAPVFAR